MAFGDIFKGKFKSDGDNTVSSGEKAAAWQKAQEVFYKNNEDLGFGKQERGLKMYFAENTKDPEHFTITLKRGKETLGEVRVDKDSGDWQLTKNNHEISKTSGFGKEHTSHTVRTRESDTLTSHSKNHRQENVATGEYHLVRNRVLETKVHGKSFEMGHLDLVAPDGKVVLSVPYNAGGKGNGAPPFKDARVSSHTETTTLIGGKLTVEALRISDKDMSGRKGILVHEGGLTSYGCLHVSRHDRQELFAAIKHIPVGQRPDLIEARDSSSKSQVSSAIRELRSHGIQVSESTVRTAPTQGNAQSGAKERV